MRFKLLLFLLLCFSLCGCNGARVVDNTYHAAGGSYVISNDMEYAGEVPATYLTRGCAGPYSNDVCTGHKRIVDDIFVRSDNSKIKEFVLVGYQRLSSGYCWLPFKADKVVFADSEFVESYSIIEAKQVHNPYLKLLADMGYSDDGGKYLTRSLLKNANDVTQVLLMYGCSENSLPEEARDNWKLTEEFLRKKMAEKIQVSGR